MFHVQYLPNTPVILLKIINVFQTDFGITDVSAFFLRMRDFHRRSSFHS